MKDGPTRGFDALVVAMLVGCAAGLAILAAGSPGWAIGAAAAAGMAGGLTALATARLGTGSLPGWVLNLGLGVSTFLVFAWAARLPQDSVIIVVAFFATLVCVGLLTRRRQLRQPRQP